MLIKNSTISTGQQSLNIIYTSISTSKQELPIKRVKGFQELGYIMKGRKTIVKRKSTKRMGQTFGMSGSKIRILNTQSFSVYGLQGTVIFISSE